jgi:hypothetical protein
MKCSIDVILYKKLVCRMGLLLRGDSSSGTDQVSSSGMRTKCLVTVMPK